MKTARPYWAIPLTIICTLLAAFVGTLPAAILLDGSSPLRVIVGGLGVAVTAVVQVYLWRRLLLRRTGLGLRWNRSAIPQALIGIVVAATAAVAANAASVAAGAADWVPRSTYATSWSAYAVLATLSVSILMQGFPEELLWRGHLYDLLSTSWSPWMVLLVTSVSFGSVHIGNLSRK